MIGEPFRRCSTGLRCLVAIATSLFPIVASAEPSEPSTSTDPAASSDAEPTAPAASSDAEPTSAAPQASREALTAPLSEPFIEHMGPDTFPGRLRGLYGGSLWLEPDFQGLQWPRNTHTGLGVSAKFWVDTGDEQIRRNSDQIPNSSMLFQQGRGVLRFTPAYVGDGFFVQAQAELVGNECQAANAVCLNTGTFTTDDLWLRVGQWDRWDLQVGRFQAWEIYHLGMGMDPYTLERLGAGMFGIQGLSTPALDAPSLYGVTFLQDRPADGLATGDVALHLYPSDFLRLELLAKLGTDNNVADNSTGGTPSNYLGGRPTAIFDLGWLKLKVGAEYQKITPTTQTLTPGTPALKKSPVAERTQKGVGASLQLVLAPIVELGVNAAVGAQHDTSAFAQEVPENTYTVKSIGGFANVRLAEAWLAGVGVNWTSQVDSYIAPNSTQNDFTAQIQGFAALQYLLARQLYVKAVFAVARADFLPSDPTVGEWTNYMFSGRVRLMYLY